MQLIRKISAKTMGWGKAEIQEACIKDKTEPHLLYRVIGIANNTRTGKSKFDDRKDDDQPEWIALLGNFQATSAQTGEVFRAGVCFMPGYVVDLVAGQLDSGDEHSSVRFGYDIYARYSEKSISSYEFFAEPLMEPPADDPLTALTAATTKPLALPPTTKAKEPAKK